MGCFTISRKPNNFQVYLFCIRNTKAADIRLMSRWSPDKFRVTWLNPQSVTIQTLIYQTIIQEHTIIVSNTTVLLTSRGEVTPSGWSSGSPLPRGITLHLSSFPSATSPNSMASYHLPMCQLQHCWTVCIGFLILRPVRLSQPREDATSRATSLSWNRFICRN